MRGTSRVLLLTLVSLVLIFCAAYSFTSRPTKSLGKPSLVALERQRDEDAAARLQEPTVVKQDKVVVIGKLTSEDTSWVQDELPDWQSAIYTVNDTTTAGLHTVQNKGRETLPYLTYLIDNYDSLPSIIAFVHAHKDGYPRAWHTDTWKHSNVRSLRDLNLSFVKRSGYANLRCNYNPGCPSWMKPFRRGAEPIGEKELLDVWPQLFGNDAKVPLVIATPCCAQFAVSREQVRQRPLSDYVKWKQWVLESELDDNVIGHIWEYLWHIAFGRDAIHCPQFKECQCDTYGRYCKK